MAQPAPGSVAVRPSGTLWDAVVGRLGKDPWPKDDELSATGLGEAWTNAYKTFVTESQQAYKLSEHITQVWNDAAGHALRDSTVQLVEELEQVAPQVAGQGLLAHRYAEVLTNTKTRMSTYIGDNQSKYEALTQSPLLFLAALAFVEIVKTGVSAILSDAMKEIQSDQQPTPAVQSSVPPGQHSVANVLNRLANGEKVDPAEVNAALNTLAEVNNAAADKIKNGGQLSTADLNFLDQSLGAMGDNITKLPDLFNGVLGPDAGAKASGIVGDSILALSNDKLGGSELSQPSTADKAGYGLPPALFNLAHNPQVNANKTYDRDGNPSTSYTLKDESGWKGLSALMGNSTLEGGADFSNDLTRRAGEIVDGAKEASKNSLTDVRTGYGLLNGSQDNHNALSSNLEDVLKASTRNEQADHNILVGADGGTVYRQLADFDWTDKGKAASGLTNWIATETIDAHAHGGENVLANEAAAGLIHITNEGGFNGGGGGAPPDPSQALFKDFIKNPEFAESAGRVAQANVAAFAQPSAQNGNTGVVNGHLEIGAEDRKDFLTSIGASPNALTGFAGSVGAYEDQIRHDLPGPVAAYHETILEDELHNAQIEATHQHDIANAQTKAASAADLYHGINVGKGIISKIASKVPGIGDVASVLIDTSAAEWRDQIGRDISVPQGSYVDLNNTDGGAGDARMAANYVNAGQIHNAPIPQDLYSGKTDAYGVPQLRDPLSAADQSRLLDALYGSGNQEWKDIKIASGESGHRGSGH
jgi:hypothetical protein